MPTAHSHLVKGGARYWWGRRLPISLKSFIDRGSAEVLSPPMAMITSSRGNRSWNASAMFSELKNIVDLIRLGITDFNRFRTGKEREAAVLDLLRAYFLFKDCVDEGESLVAEAGPDPLKKIADLDEWTAASTLNRWDAVLQRQSQRLGSLQGAIFGQHHLAVINPALQDKIAEIIGSKWERANSLHAIGAALFFRFTFPIAKSNEERAAYVSVMAGARNNLLDMENVGCEIARLRDALDEYRSVVERLLSVEEITKFSRQARLDTLWKIVEN
jgi:hypothetical protein